MKTEKYIFNKLDNLTEEDILLGKCIVKKLGDWAKPVEVASYLKRNIGTIYDMIEREEIIARRMRGRLRIFTLSLVLILEKK